LQRFPLAFVALAGAASDVGNTEGAEERAAQPVAEYMLLVTDAFIRTYR
jgi:hypothetical protein